MKICAAGICGSDVLIQEDHHFYRAPVTQGHEFVGLQGRQKCQPGQPRMVCKEHFGLYKQLYEHVKGDFKALAQLRDQA
jgi:hypothetical protein